MSKYTDYYGKREPQVSMYRRNRNANTPDDSLSSWVSIPPPAPEVYERGNCRELQATDPVVADYFFLDVPSRTKDKIAKEYCKGCPVKAPCLAYAMRLPWNIDFGIWGGTNRNERKIIRDGKRKAPQV